MAKKQTEKPEKPKRAKKANAARKANSEEQLEEGMTTPPPTPAVKKTIEHDDVDDDGLPADEDAGAGGSPATSTVAVTPKKRRNRTPAKPKTPATIYEPLPSSMGDALAIVACAEHGQMTSQVRSPNNDHGLILQMISPLPFEYVTTIQMDQGELDGHVAIILRPGKPFPWDKLPQEIKLDILRRVVAPQGVVGRKITISMKKDTLDSDEYSEGLKNRLGVMQVNKELCDMTRSVLYSHPLKFEDPMTMMTFLSTKPVIKEHITVVEIETYKKPNIKIALNSLAGCPNLRKLHFLSNVNMNATPRNAANAFKRDADFLLGDLCAHKGGPDGTMSVLRFGRSMCFAIKEEGGTRKWTDEEMSLFGDTLRALLR